MLGVAFAKLVLRAQKKMLAYELRLRVDQRHDVLQLIAKTERSAGLVKAAAPP